MARQGFLNDNYHTGNALYLWDHYQDYRNRDGFLEEQAVIDNNLVTANGTAALEFTNLVLQMIDFSTEKKINKIIDLYKIGFYNYCERYGHPFA